MMAATANREQFGKPSPVMYLPLLFPLNASLGRVSQYHPEIGLRLQGDIGVDLPYSSGLPPRSGIYLRSERSTIPCQRLI
jgi:hypothetical protein